jgi:hypothetical protein
MPPMLMSPPSMGHHRPRRRRNALRRGEEPVEQPGVIPCAVPGRQMLGRPSTGLPAPLAPTRCYPYPARPW